MLTSASLRPSSWCGALPSASSSPSASASAPASARHCRQAVVRVIRRLFCSITTQVISTEGRGGVLWLLRSEGPGPAHGLCSRDSTSEEAAAAASSPPLIQAHDRHPTLYTIPTNTALHTECYTLVKDCSTNHVQLPALQPAGDLLEGSQETHFVVSTFWTRSHAGHCSAPYTMLVKTVMSFVFRMNSEEEEERREKKTLAEIALTSERWNFRVHLFSFLFLNMTFPPKIILLYSETHE